MSNEQENATIEKTDAEKKQVEINTFLSLQSVIGDEQVIQMICDVLDIDYDDVKDQIPKDDPYADLESQLGGEGNGIEQPNEGSPESGAE